MNILAFNGSPRRAGNTSHLLREFLRGAREAGARAEEFAVEELNLKYCRGCLRCNVLKRCAIKVDDWPEISEKILAADVLVFASPVYFHHVSAPLKKLLDRFRSFIHVQIIEQGLRHTPWQPWQKRFVLLLCLGSSGAEDAQPVIDLFDFLTVILGPGNTLTPVIGTRLAVAGQVQMPREKLEAVYAKLQLPASLAEKDYEKNQELLRCCYNLGRESGAEKK